MSLFRYWNAEGEDALALYCCAIYIEASIQ